MGGEWPSCCHGTRVSGKGQVVLPDPIRRKLGVRPGDPLDANREGGRIVPTPRATRARKVSIFLDPVTDLPVLAVRMLRS